MLIRRLEKPMLTRSQAITCLADTSAFRHQASDWQMVGDLV
jgi:hypothetical protein